jgi:DNA-binding NarL/FixJ family response regulator
LTRAWIGKCAARPKTDERRWREWKKLRPDIVILDFQMPVWDGLEAARHIRDLSPRTAMLMFTMPTSGELLKAALEAGVAEVVSKSARLADHLSTALHQILA